MSQDSLTARTAGTTDFRRQCANWRLTTAEILYRMPDHPSMLQTFIWQKLDLPPRFPELLKFLAFWERNIEGPLHSVRVGHVDIIAPGRWRALESAALVH
ncbi:MAG: protein usg [Alphaproteobacteria bacterium]